MSRNITWLLLLAFYIYDIFCNDNLLSKFHQNGYKIKGVRVELISYDENYFNIFKIVTYKFNRTTPAVNCSVNMKISLTDKTEAIFQSYKFLSNEYRHFPIRFQANIKKIFDANAGGLRNVKKCGNFSDFFFYKDTTYYVCNFVFDETQFPPLIPNGRYKIEVKGLHLNKVIATLHGFGEVYTPISYPNN